MNPQPLRNIYRRFQSKLNLSPSLHPQVSIGDHAAQLCHFMVVELYIVGREDEYEEQQWVVCC